MLRLQLSGICVILGAAAVVSRVTSPPTSHRSAANAAAPDPVQTGANVSLAGRRPFPDDDPWNRDISKDPVDPNSPLLIAGIGLAKSLHPDFGTVYEGAPVGIPYVVISRDQPKVKVEFEHRDESDPGPYPVPPDAPIEGGPQSKGDRHVLVLDKDNWKLYELYAAYPQDGGKWWKAASGAVWDLSRNSTQRPKGWTSADAAGLPVFAGLVRYDEVVERKQIRHALRFTARSTRRAYVAPATHFASRKTDPNLPPMGMRVRLKAQFDVSGYPPNCQVILNALKTYGMILADNGGDWFITGAPDPRWDDSELHKLKRVKGLDFEVIKMGPVTTR